MQIEFLGTAGPMSVPRPLCRCVVCQEAREKGVPYSRTCPGLFLHGPNLLIDTSEDISFQLNRSRIEEIRGVFYSHWHPDHVMGRRVLESLNANYVNHPPMNRLTQVFVPQQVAADFEQFLGTGEHLRFYESKRWVKLHHLLDGQSVTFGATEITPFRLPEQFAYGFQVCEEDKRAVIVPDEMSHWDPAPEYQEADIAVLPIGVFEVHPLTGERIVPSSHPVLLEECLFPETLEVVRKLNAKTTYLTHINGLSFNELRKLEQMLQAQGLNIHIAYDTLVVSV